MVTQLLSDYAILLLMNFHKIILTLHVSVQIRLNWIQMQWAWDEIIMNNPPPPTWFNRQYFVVNGFARVFMNTLFMTILGEVMVCSKHLE